MMSCSHIFIVFTVAVLCACGPTEQQARERTRSAVEGHPIDASTSFTLPDGTEFYGSIALLVGPSANDLAFVGQGFRDSAFSLQLGVKIPESQRPRRAASRAFEADLSLTDPFDSAERSGWRLSLPASSEEQSSYFVRRVRLSVSADSVVTGVITAVPEGNIDYRTRTIREDGVIDVRVRGTLSGSCLRWLEPEAETTGSGTFLIDTARSSPLCREWVVDP